MSTVDWLVLLLLGGLVGMIGQGIRVIPGLKKLHDNTAQPGSQTFGELFNLGRLISSLLIGFVAGALVAIAVSDGGQIDKKIIFTFLAAGYAGTDFIEGFMRKYLPATPGGSAQPGANPRIAPRPAPPSPAP